VPSRPILPLAKVFINTGDMNSVQNIVLSINTHNTLFERREIFLKISYTPNDNADVIAKIIHIFNKT
jgi:hypothetical protein